MTLLEGAPTTLGGSMIPDRASAKPHRFLKHRSDDRCKA
jgi:hypothetical protein